MPIALYGDGRHQYLCSSRGEAIDFHFPSEKKQYRVKEDSFAYGYIAVVHYLDRWNGNTYERLEVGSGSEFKIDSCQFRVIKVYNLYNKDTVGPTKYVIDNIMLQRLAVPKGCCGVNRYLKEFDKNGLPKDWEEQLFKD